MLSNKATSLMLNTYKGLSYLRVLDSNNIFLGGIKNVKMGVLI